MLEVLEFFFESIYFTLDLDVGLEYMTESLFGIIEVRMGVNDVFVKHWIKIIFHMSISICVFKIGGGMSSFITRMRVEWWITFNFLLDSSQPEFGIFFW